MFSYSRIICIERAHIITYMHIYIYTYIRIYSWLYNKWVCIYTYIYIFMYSDINTFVQRTTRHHQIPSNDCHDSNVDCRDDVGGGEVVIIIYKHYNRNIPQSPCSFDQWTPGLSPTSIFSDIFWHTWEVFPHTDWLILGSDGFRCFSCVPMLQAFPNPKSFGKTRQAHRQKFPDGAVALKPQNLKGNNIFRNEQGKGYTNLCSFKAWKVSLLLVSS